MRWSMTAMAVALVALTAACSSTEVTTTTAPPTAAELLEISAATMGSVDTADRKATELDVAEP